MHAGSKPPIRRRFVLLTILGIAGAILFVPSIMASANPRPPAVPLALFALIVSVISAFSARFGLRLADAAHLPMPYLRRLDGQYERSRRGGFFIAIIFGAAFAAIAIYVLHRFEQPNLPGALWSRIASVFFAAGTLELVLHLLVMSLFVRLARGRVWVGIIVSAALFVAFHVAGLPPHHAVLLFSSVLFNGVFGLALGLLYARYGFEYLLLCHAIGHLLAVTLA